MGIVRDVTVDQLTQAVGNIDTSTLAQDSTLQDVVTAIGNISGGNDPVTNTTVNSLCKDTTGQDIKDSLDDIKSAVQGLGTALGSDKANISGDNIANPSAFRSAIGVKQYIMEYKEIPLTYSSSSNPVAIGSANAAKTGYTPIGIVGWQVSGASSSLVYVPSLFIDNVSVSYTVRVTAGGSYSHTLYVAVLYQSNS